MVVTVKDLSLDLVMMMMTMTVMTMTESFGIKIEIMCYDQFSINQTFIENLRYVRTLYWNIREGSYLYMLTLMALKEEEEIVHPMLVLQKSELKIS